MEKGISCLDIIAVCDVSVDSTVHLRDFPMCWKSLLVMSSLCVESRGISLKKEFPANEVFTSCVDVCFCRIPLYDGSHCL